jgi:hypothetical protein
MVFPVVMSVSVEFDLRRPAQACGLSSKSCGRPRGDGGA